MTDHPNDTHALVGAYVVDALDDLERARFEHHLAECPECRVEVAELSETAAYLATDEVAPPPELREQVLAGIETIRPLPPVTRGRGRAVGLAARRLPLALVAAAAVVLIALVGGFVIPNLGDDDAPQQPTVAQQVLDADDAIRTSHTFPDGSKATVVASPSVDRAVILTEDMAPAPAGKVFQLWFQNEEGAMEPAGLMPDDSDATVVLDGELSTHTAVGITVEPDGGSEEPRSAPLAVFPLET